jgi:CRP/FNR family cyclic AMP-dependent transcriptional regulator
MQPMPSEESASGYFIWGADLQAYGPVELPTLVSWIKDERVLADTWIFLERGGCWEKAEHTPELQMFFHARPSHQKVEAEAGTADEEIDGVSPAVLRHVKVLGGLNDEQLARFVRIMQVKQIPQGKQLAKQGDPSDAMYLVVEGELRLRAHTEGREHTLASIHAGEFFGEIALFDHGPRSADVIATTDCTLVKVPAAEFEKFVYETPDLAAPFLLALAKTLTTRMRSENRRYRDSIAYVRPPGTH